jgi:hypothetical protein
MAELRERGYFPAIAERFNPFAKVRQDLYGFIDILAVHPDGRLLAIQTCSGEGGDPAARVRKILALPIAKLLAGHMEIEVWSWARRVNPAGRGRRKVWTLKVESLTARLLPKRSLLRRQLEGMWP